MDIEVSNHKLFELPPKMRVAAILHDGARDLKLWPGPGDDKTLARQHGRDLAALLDSERGSLPGDTLELGAPFRLHPGNLHCDYLLWLATREAESGASRAPAPSLGALAAAVTAGLEFVAERGGERVALGALGAGPEAADARTRLEAVARAAAAFAERRAAAGRPAVIETLVICVPEAAEARALAGRLQVLLRDSPVVSLRTTYKLPAFSEKKPARKATSASKTSTGTGRSRRSGLSADEVSRARAAAPVYDRHAAYAVGGYLQHPKFGVGRVEATEAGGRVVLKFEDGETRRLLHAGP